jgi:hypothetical protein
MPSHSIPSILVPGPAPQELDGKELRSELDGNELPPKYDSDDAYNVHELEASGGRARTRRRHQSDVSASAASDFRSLYTLAQAVKKDPKFQFGNKEELESLVIDYYESFPLSPQEAGERRAQQSSKQTEEIIQFMVGLEDTAKTKFGVDICVADGGEQGSSVFKAVLNASTSEERLQLSDSDFVFQPRSASKQPARVGTERYWTELTVTVRSSYFRALAEVLLKQFADPQDGNTSGTLTKAWLVGAERRDTSCVTAILHIAEASEDRLSAQAQAIHDQLVDQLKTGNRSKNGPADLYVQCPPGHKPMIEGLGIGRFDRSSTRFPELSTACFIGRIVTDALSESCRYKVGLAQTLNENLISNGRTGALLTSLHPIHVVNRRHSATAILERNRRALSPSLRPDRAVFLADRPWEPVFDTLLALAQKIAKACLGQAMTRESIVSKATKYYVTNPLPPDVVTEIYGGTARHQHMDAVIDMLFNLDLDPDRAVSISIRTAAKQKQWLRDIWEEKNGGNPDEKAKLLESLRREAIQMLPRNPAHRVDIGESDIRSSLSIAVKDEYAPYLVVARARMFKNVACAGSICDEVWVSNMGVANETIEVYLRDRDPKKAAIVARGIDQMLREVIEALKGPLNSDSKLYRDPPPDTIRVRSGMGYSEIYTPQRKTRQTASLRGGALGAAVADSVLEQKDLTTALHIRLREARLSSKCPAVVLGHDGDDELRQFIADLRSETP